MATIDRYFEQTTASLAECSRSGSAKCTPGTSSCKPAQKRKIGRPRKSRVEESAETKRQRIENVENDITGNVLEISENYMLPKLY